MLSFFACIAITKITQSTLTLDFVLLAHSLLSNAYERRWKIYRPIYTYALLYECDDIFI